MKPLKFLILLFSIFFVFEAQASSFYEVYPQLIKKGQLVSKNDYEKSKIKPFYSDAEIYYYKDSNSYYELKVLPNDVIMMRDPETNIANFGNASLDDFSDQSWQAVCVKDEITDSITCMITNKSITLMMSDGRKMISSVKDIKNLDLYKKQYVRIDENTAISATGIIENPKFNQIVSQMKNGRIIKTRYYDARGNEQNNSSSLDGFKYAYQYMIKLEEQLKKPY
ncbi:hypothetical protein [Acinetobacter soli]|uniref:Uncharacterized protein n=1 Tax=Acinetobacter soli TaxID=487316 RepID=A0A1P8EF72_9GAMM|nr:hypothetical protein [Acinetobacter soli]APV34846.1 hypothetical protein BEN76_01935 [Acinetobacter soli]